MYTKECKEFVLKTAPILLAGIIAKCQDPEGCEEGCRRVAIDESIALFEDIEARFEGQMLPERTTS